MCYAQLRTCSEINLHSWYSAHPGSLLCANSPLHEKRACNLKCKCGERRKEKNDCGRWLGRTKYSTPCICGWCSCNEVAVSRGLVTARASNVPFAQCLFPAAYTATEGNLLLKLFPWCLISPNTTRSPPTPPPTPTITANGIQQTPQF